MTDGPAASHVFVCVALSYDQFERMVATWHKKRCADTFPPSFGWDPDDYDTYMGFKDADPAANDAMCATLSHAFAYPADNRLETVEVDDGGESAEVAGADAPGEHFFVVAPSVAEVMAGYCTGIRPLLVG